MSEIRIDQDLDPTFNRDSVAYKRDNSTTVSADEVRYENVIDPIVIDTKRELDRGTYTRLAASGNVICSEAWRPTFTRSGSGFIDGVPYNTNVPRYASGGILIEESSANLCQYSETFSVAAWGKSGYSSTGFIADAIAAPNGTVTADKFVEDTSTGSHLMMTASITASASTAYTFSIYAKAGERSIIWLGMSSYVNWTGSDPEYEYNLSTGVATNRGAASNIGGMVYVGDGWWRCWFTATSTSAGSFSTRGNVWITSTAGTASYTGDGTSGTYFWGAQLEAKAYPTTYIPTPSSSSVSRASDSFSIPNFSSAPTLSSSGGVVARVYVDRFKAGATPNSLDNSFNYLIDIDSNASSTNRVSLGLTPNSSLPWRAFLRGPNNESTTFATHTLTEGWHTVGIFWSGSNFEVYADGVSKGTATVAGLIVGNSASARITLGGAYGNSDHSNVVIDYVACYSSNVSDANRAIYSAATTPTGADYQASFASNLNFATSGVYVSEWINLGVSGAISSGSAVSTLPAGTAILTEYRTANSDTQSDASSWSTTLGTGKYVQFRHTLVSSESTDALPYVTSTTITPADYGKAITVEEATENLIASPTSPAATENVLTMGGDYSLWIAGTDSSSGSVVIEHKKIETTTADFSAGTHSGTTASSNELTLDTATADPTFTRATSATKKDGTTAASGTARYEDVIQQLLLTTNRDWNNATLERAYSTPDGKLGMAITDDFDTVSSGFYTSAVDTGSLTATFNTASSRLELSNAGINDRSSYTYNNFTAKNIAVEATISQAVDCGIILRYVDNNNYYLLSLRDDTVTGTNNLVIAKRVGGTFTNLASYSNITFTRGTQTTFRFEVVESVLKAYQDGVLIQSVSDTSLTAAGKVGFYSTSTTANYFHSFKIDPLTPLFGRNSIAFNPQTGASVAANIPRYMKGKNLLDKNRADVETDLAGIGANGMPGVTLTRDTTEFWQGTACAKAVTNGANNFQGLYAFTNLPQGQYVNGGTYVASMYVKGSGSLQINTRFYYADGTFSQAATSFTADSTWTRRSSAATATAGKVINSIQAMIYTNPAQSVTFYVDGLQVEYGSTATTWVPGGDNAILVEEGTTNFFSSNSENFTTGWQGYLGSSGTITSTQSDPFGGTSAYRIQTTGGSNVIKYYNAPSTTANGTRVSASIWVKNNDASNSVTVEGGASADFKSVTVASTEGWKLCKLENSLSNGTGSTQIRFISAAAGTDVDVTVMYPQVEAKAYCTSYITPGTTRQADILCIPSYPASNWTEGTTIVRVYVAGDAAETTVDGQRMIFDTGNGSSTTNRIVLYQNTGTPGTWTLRMYNSAGTQTNATYAATLTEGWHLFGARWSGTRLSLYIDGVERGFTTSVSLPTIPTDARVYVGSNSNAGTGQHGFAIDDINFYSTALSDSDMVTATTNS